MAEQSVLASIRGHPVPLTIAWVLVGAGCLSVLVTIAIMAGLPWPWNGFYPLAWFLLGFSAYVLASAQAKPRSESAQNVMALGVLLMFLSLPGFFVALFAASFSLNFL